VIPDEERELSCAPSAHRCGMAFPAGNRETVWPVAAYGEARSDPEAISHLGYGLYRKKFGRHFGVDQPNPGGIIAVCETSRDQSLSGRFRLMRWTRSLESDVWGTRVP
jgi:hypothetical protein